HLQQRRLAGQLKSISVMQGCAESSRHYSKPGLITTYTCDSRLTNAVLYAEVVIRMHTIGYQTYYDRTYGSSLKYNAYEVGFSRGSYEAVYLFNNQTNFVDAQKSGMAEKSAGGYTLKLYDN
ncbi:MAG TPA: hypothetical protein VG964_01390, partial [Candidatus Saccharimonadales bacterium]|nr:hypothetical protein [Candidatus Saccharimonadales bacterium]